METSSQVSEHHQTSLWVLSIKSSDILINDPQSCRFIFIWVVMFERCLRDEVSVVWSVMLYFSVDIAGVHWNCEPPPPPPPPSPPPPLLRVLSRPTDSSPPHNTKEGLVLQLSSSLTDLGWNLNVEDNVGVVARNVVVTVVLVGLKGAAPPEVWSPHIVISRHHLPPLQQLGHKPGWPVFYPNDASLLGPIVSLLCSS